MTMKTEAHGSTDMSGISRWTPGEYALRDAWFPVAQIPQIGPNGLRRLVHSQPIYIWRGAEGYRAAEFSREQLDSRRGEFSAFTGGTGEYPVVERYDHLWVWYGNPENADASLIPDIPFLSPSGSEPGFARGTLYLQCTYELVLENVLDLTHVDFVHGNFAGSHESQEDNVRFESTSETVTMIRSVKHRKTSDYFKSMGVTAEFQDQDLYTHVYIRSGVCFLHTHYSAAPSMPLMQTNTPESRYLTRCNFVFATRESYSDEYARAWPATAPLVAAQDQSMLRPQNPRYLHAVAGVDRSSRFDAAGIQFRARYNALVARQRDGDYSYLPDAAQGSGMARVFGSREIGKTV
jgi:phenylpropionate dioxygenase-like ring-hydroxylating dioxygenase large terminal subunit